MVTRFDVRCSSCNRRVGIATSETTSRNAIYCDSWCLAEPKATPMEARNDEWRALTMLGMSPVRVARLYGVVHPLVYKVLARA